MIWGSRFWLGKPKTNLGLPGTKKFLHKTISVSCQNLFVFSEKENDFIAAETLTFTRNKLILPLKLVCVWF